MSVDTDQLHPVKVHVVQDDTNQPVRKKREISSTLNAYVLTVGATPTQILAHAPSRIGANLLITASNNDIIAFGGSQSDCQDAVNSPSQFLGKCSYIVGPFASDIEMPNTDEIWAVLLSNAVAANPTPSQPAVPATGVAQQNTNSYPVQVVISPNGATITNVSVNGITVGTAAGTYTIPAYGAISIAYSVATPTWVWSNPAAQAAAGTIVVSVIKHMEIC